MNLTPLALAALYAYAKGQDQPDKNIPGAAPTTEPTSVTPTAPAAPAPTQTQNAADVLSSNQALNAGMGDYDSTGNIGKQPAVKPTVPVKKKPVVTATTTKPQTPSDGVNAGEGDYGTTGNVGKYNPPDARLASLKKSLQWIAATPAMRQQMLNNLGMDPSLAAEPSSRNPRTGREYSKGGKTQAYAKGGVVSSSKRGDGIARKGFTKGVMR